jgi:hypothetical protein
MIFSQTTDSVTNALLPHPKSFQPPLFEFIAVCQKMPIDALFRFCAFDCSMHVDHFAFVASIRSTQCHSCLPPFDCLLIFVATPNHHPRIGAVRTWNKRVLEILRIGRIVSINNDH